MGKAAVGVTSRHFPYKMSLRQNHEWNFVFCLSGGLVVELRLRLNREGDDSCGYGT